jgi:hypothetical protein
VLIIWTPHCVIFTCLTCVHYTDMVALHSLICTCQMCLSLSYTPSLLYICTYAHLACLPVACLLFFSFTHFPFVHYILVYAFITCTLPSLMRHHMCTQHSVIRTCVHYIHLKHTQCRDRQRYFKTYDVTRYRFCLAVMAKTLTVR